jgi:hypothetical protein
MGRVEDALRLAIVHVSSHSRQRQTAVTVTTFARVSMILPSQNGHTAGRATPSANRGSGIMLFLFSGRRNPERMRGLTEQADDRQPQPQAAEHNGSRRDRALPGLPVVFHASCDPSRPSLIGGACVSPVGYPHPGVHDTCWRLLDSAAVQE